MKKLSHKQQLLRKRIIRQQLALEREYRELWERFQYLIYKPDRNR